MTELTTDGHAQRIEYDEYSVLFDDYGGFVAALPGHDPATAYEAFQRQFRGMGRPRAVGMQKLHLVKDYGEPELVEWSPPE